ncbi:hypothetical protein [Neorhizobium sp. DAR64872/K0K18]|uniref:hypothetical protein n=1 Tax=Neorhizobium sp. DAR64872/K0K18 TaxID=3421958 RepID=UPI003D29459C
MTDTSKHTPGPWGLTEDGDWLQLAGGQEPIVDGRYMSICVNCISDADKRLIAAAPELLYVAELVVSWLDEDEGAHALCDKARAAIAKATGGAA